MVGCTFEVSSEYERFTYCLTCFCVRVSQESGGSMHISCPRNILTVLNVSRVYILFIGLGRILYPGYGVIGGITSEHELSCKVLYHVMNSDQTLMTKSLRDGTICRIFTSPRSQDIKPNSRIVKLM